jgi:hypothetical protein
MGEILTTMMMIEGIRNEAIRPNQLFYRRNSSHCRATEIANTRDRETEGIDWNLFVFCVDADKPRIINLSRCTVCESCVFFGGWEKLRVFKGIRNQGS